MAFDILVRTLYTDSGLSAGLAKANAQLNAIGRSGPGARAGLRAVETGARQLAFSASGLGGPMGTIARGLLQIGGGNALVLGAVAGLGLVAGAYAIITKGARDAKKEQDDFIASLRQLGPQATATAERIKLAGLIGQRGQRQTLGGLGREFLSDMTGGRVGASREEQRQALERQIATQTIAVANAERAAGNAADERLKKLRRLADEIARENELQRQAIVIKGKLLGLARLDAIALVMATDRARAKSAALELDLPFGKQASDGKSAIEGRARRPGLDRTELAQMALMSLMMGARGGASGAFGAAGGLLSGISGLKGVGAGLAGPLGWAGFGLSAIGGIFGLFNNDEERRHKEMLQAMRDLRPIIEQARVTRIIVSPTGQFIAQAEHEIGRREDRDAVDRDGRSI